MIMIMIAAPGRRGGMIRVDWIAGARLPMKEAGFDTIQSHADLLLSKVPFPCAQARL